MRLLAADTSTGVLNLAIKDGPHEYLYQLGTGTKLSSVFAPTIKRILDIMGWMAQDIDYFACGLGPGSFTGVRIGLATFKGLAWSLGKPLAGVPTLDVLARNILQVENIRQGLVVPVVDAKRNLLYSAMYKFENGRLKLISPYMLLDCNALIKKVRGQLVRTKRKYSVTLLGDALALHKEALSKANQSWLFLSKDYWFVHPGNLLAVANEKVKEKRVSSVYKLEPIYLYPKECQIRSKSK